MTRRQTHSSDRGAALVEFAVVVPVLLLLFAAMIDFGLLFQRYLVLTNAAREGARIAVLPGYFTPDVQARVTAYYRAGTNPDAPAPTTAVNRIDITTAGAPPFQAAEVTVTATHTYLLLGSVGAFFGGGFGNITLGARAVMRVEGG